MRAFVQAFGGAFVMHLRLYGTHPYRVFQVLIFPGLMSLLATLILRAHEADTGFFRIAVGAGLVGMWASLLGTSMFTISREREWYGTFETLTGVPASLTAIFGGYIFADAVSSLAALPISFLVAAALVDVDFGSVDPAAMTGSLAAASIAMFSLALVLAPLMALFPVLTRWANALEYPVWIVGGFLFPIALLPGWTTPISNGLTAYWAAESLQRAADDAGVAELLPLWGAVVALSAAYIAVSVVLFNLSINRLKRTGALAYG